MGMGGDRCMVRRLVPFTRAWVPETNNGASPGYDEICETTTGKAVSLLDMMIARKCTWVGRAGMRCIIGTYIRQ